MNTILGLNCNHADSSACIIKDGELLIAIEEERINREKHWAGLPVNSIKQCLKYTNTNISEITDIAINSNPLSNINNKIFFFLKNYLFGKKKYEIIKRIKKKINIKKDLNSNFFPENLSKKTKVSFIDHHISHIASAFYPSNFKRAVGLSIDGFGDFCSLSIAKCNYEKIEIIDRIFFPDSLGLLYEAFTQLIGFKNYGDEYKIMGLSSFGQPKYYDKIKKNIFTNENSFKLNLEYFNHTDKNFSYNFSGKPNQAIIFNNKIIDMLGIEINNSNFQEVTNLQKNLASSIQKIFEEKIEEIIKKISKINYSKNLVYAGGCALNSLANRKFYNSNMFENIFIPYAPGDGGGAIGAALIVSKKKDKKVKFSNLTSPFIGPNYDDKTINDAINANTDLKKYKIEKVDDKNKLYTSVAKYIFENKIVGFFNDKMEFGARALGNRSILANPCDKNIKEIINKKIKRRESFRPFAPAVLFEKKEDWFDNNFKNPYMSAVENINESKKKFIPAVTHVDGTGRVQTVNKETNPNFYFLIEKFNNLSNVPILLNTSFNENEPIVMTPNDAINCFLRTDMDILVLNTFLITR
tara:strand:+ start:1690 stop:3432 length:1743 start_codon:yes stop_codon:yes gene_type:complete